MPSQKGKGCPVSQRCQAASKSDDATLAQKRVYWRNKKREQRARLSEKRSKSTQDGQQEHQAYVYVSPGVNARLSDRLASSSISKDVSCSYLSKSGKTGEQSPTKPPENQEWSQTMTVSKVIQPTHSSVSARAADGVTVKCPGLAKSCGSQLNTSLSLPQVRVTRITSNCSTKTEPKPCGSMQSSSEAEVKLNVPKVSLIGVTADTMHGSSNCPVFSETAVQRAHATPQSGTKSALVTNKRVSGFGMTPVTMDSEEERAAKQREQWRIKKREQRAKLAKARERPQSRDRTFQGLTAQKTRVVANSALLTSQSYFGSTGPKQTALQVKVPYTAPRLEADKLRSRLAVTNLQTNLKKDQIPQQHTMENTAIATFDVTQVKTSPESQRKPINFHHHSNISQGIASCKTPRQRSAETHKSFLNQRNLRSKPPSTAAMFRTRAMPKMDPNDTPEQILAKRREYWRNKKREQRAKLSLEKKIRLKEKDSLTRRVKRYQQILEEMRKARALVQSTERAPMLANEAIGGFIEEDGTLTVNIPQSQEEKLHALSKTSNWGGVSPSSVNPLSLPALSSQGKLGFSPAVQTFNKTSKRLNVKTWSDIAITASSGSKSRKSSQQLTLTHFQSPHNEPSSAGSKFGGCVMKMNISNHKQSLSALSGGTKLTEEERTAKKREYWRTKKREQRAARAFRLKQSVFQARSTVALLRRKAQTQESPKTERLSTNLAICEEKEHFPNNTVPDILYANEIKQEDESAPASDLNSLPVQAICPDIKLPTTPPAPPVPQLESEPQPSLNADSQATTLLAVASMKKLLEESLSTVSESQTQEAGGAFEAVRDTSEQDKKPVLSTIYCENNEKALVAACVPSKMESLQFDSNILKGKDLPTPPLKDLSQIREVVQSLSTSGEPPHSLCDQSSQTPSTPFVSTASSRRTQRSHSKNWADQNHSFDEPPKLHHITTEAVDPPQLRQLNQQSPCHNSHVPLAERYRTTMRHTSSSSLQKKREYWKLMKRQQRAKLKARQKELLSRNTKTEGLHIGTKCLNPSKPAVQPSPSVATGSSVPEVLVVTTSRTEQPLEGLQSHTIIISQEGNGIDGPPPHLPAFEGEASSLPALKPPDNPLSTIHVKPIEYPRKNQNPILSPIKIPCGQPQSRIYGAHSSASSATLMPPKPIPGEGQEDFLRRKREYWRLKKKEQRARKASQGKGSTPTRASSDSRSVLSAQDLKSFIRATQDPDQWANSSEHPMSVPAEPDPESLMFPTYPAPAEGQDDVWFADYDDEEETLTEAAWRSRYLMDYDPLNQLLVCMVCGELQYSHGLEAVRAHIDEAHPLTLRLEPREKQKILEAWDEQVSQRERFFSSQLQQHCGPTEETNRN